MVWLQVGPERAGLMGDCHSDGGLFEMGSEDNLGDFEI